MLYWVATRGKGGKDVGMGSAARGLAAASQGAAPVPTIATHQLDAHHKSKMPRIPAAGKAGDPGGESKGGGPGGDGIPGAGKGGGPGGEVTAGSKGGGPGGDGIPAAGVGGGPGPEGESKGGGPGGDGIPAAGKGGGPGGEVTEGGRGGGPGGDGLPGAGKGGGPGGEDAVFGIMHVDFPPLILPGLGVFAVLCLCLVVLLLIRCCCRGRRAIELPPDHPYHALPARSLTPKKPTKEEEEDFDLFEGVGGMK